MGMKHIEFGGAKGILQIFKNDKLVYEHENLYTNDGLRQGFAAWLAGEEPTIPSYIALGASNDPGPSVSSERVSKEFSRVELTGKSVSIRNYQARLTAHFVSSKGNGVIRQVGLFDIDSDREVLNELNGTSGWDTFPINGVSLAGDTVIFIAGSGSFKLTVSSSPTTASLSHDSLGSDLSNIATLNNIPVFHMWFRPSDMDSFSSVQIEIGNDSNDLWRWDINSSEFMTDTWSLIELDTSNATEVGSPSFTSNIDYFEAEITMVSGRSGNVEFNFDNLSAFVHQGTLWNIAPANVHKTAGDVLNVVWIISLEEDS